MLPSEFRVEKSDTGYRVALYRHGKFYVTFIDGLTLAAAQREARSLTVFWQRLRPHSEVVAVRLKPAS